MHKWIDPFLTDLCASERKDVDREHRGSVGNIPCGKKRRLSPSAVVLIRVCPEPVLANGRFSVIGKWSYENVFSRTVPVEIPLEIFYGRDDLRLTTARQR